MSSPKIWSAGRYESVAGRIAPIAIQLMDAVERLRPVHDAALVDLACGTGNAAMAAAARGARVTAVDITPELITIAREKAAGLPITWLTADASATGLPDASFDAAVSNMGIIFVEPTRQVAEFKRLLKPGATLAFSSWVHEPTNPFFTPIIDVLGPPPPSEYTPDQWGDAETTATRLSDGFDDVTIENSTLAWEFTSLDAAVNFVTNESPMHVALLGNVDAAKREPLRAAFEAAMRAHGDGSGVRFDAPYVVVTARRR